MDYGKNKQQDSVYSNKVRAGKRRTYFFDVRQTKGEDFYITLTESTRRFNDDGFERHKIFVYKEDFNRFLAGLTDAMDKVKNDLMPDYDYDEFTRRHQEYEARRLQEDAAAAAAENQTTDEPQAIEEKAPEPPEVKDESKPIEDEDDMAW